jgi:hypothetical protein
MVLEHLMESGSTYAQILIHLSHGERPSPLLDPISVRPEGRRGIEVVEDFESFLADYAAAVAEDAGDRESELRHPHPSYGELTAYGWHRLAAFHQRIHRHQMERIVANLGK